MSAAPAVDGRRPEAGIFALPDQVHDPRTRLLWNYWAGKCGAGRLPGRRDLQPQEMKPFLPIVALVDVERRRGQPRFRIRLIGSEAAEIFGDDGTGRYIDDIVPPALLPAVQARLLSVAQTRRPAYGVQPVPRPHRDFVRYEHLTVPLASDGVTVDMLLGARCVVRTRRVESDNHPPA
jgi:hypothetical protein